VWHLFSEDEKIGMWHLVSGSMEDEKISKVFVEYED